MKNYYDIFKINKDAKEDEIRQVLSNAEEYYANGFRNHYMTADEYKSKMKDLKEAEAILLNRDERQRYDKALNSSSKKTNRGSKVTNVDSGDKITGKAKRYLAGLTAAAVAMGVMVSCGVNLKKNKSVTVTPASSVASSETIEEEIADSEYQGTLVGSDDGGSEEETETVTPGSSSSETTSSSSEKTTETRKVLNYGDIYDEDLLQRRAEALVGTLNAAGITNISTGEAYTTSEIVNLIKYANGVYTPESTEEIDLLQLDLLNLLISPLNTDAYLYHVAYASGNDGFRDQLTDPIRVDFAEAFAEYGNNGVYPLIEWLQEKRFQMYSSTNRDEINSIYEEVGQLMADLMKGNGATITYQDDKEEATRTFTSEQILSNYSSAMLLTTEVQLIFANHYEYQDENGVVDEVGQEWEVYNKYNRDEEGNLIPDTVTYDEINAWINNGCDYEWGIDEILADGQTFGQRVQGNLEGMALNNYAMKHDSKKLTK